MIPRDYQIKLSEHGLAVLNKYMIVYYAMEERTGKTLTALLVAEASNAERVLIITKKKPVADWLKTLKAWKHTKQYEVINYHNAHKMDRADLIILDEAHNYISAYPKPGKIWKEIKALTINTPIIFLSATPYAQGPQMLYNQFNLSNWSPWVHYKNFYQWFKRYGNPYKVEINGIEITQYDRCKVDEVIDSCKHLFITKTRAELGFEHEPEDKLHYISLSPAAKYVYNELLEHNIVELKAGMLVCDTTSKLRFALHMLEGGTAKLDNERIILVNKEKIDYILANFGDTEDTVIMYNYIAEEAKLKQYFKKAKILQATSYSEGIDLSMYRHLIIYSQDFSTARHNQRRARQANMLRKEPITVHHLLVKKAISEQVYKTVSINKRNFVDSVFTRSKI